LQSGYRFGDSHDLAELIGEEGIKRLLEIVCDAYDMLSKNHCVQSRMSEDEITELLFKEVQFIWMSSALETVYPINQKIDRTYAKNRGRPPTIDFCFRDRYVKEASLVSNVSYWPRATIDYTKNILKMDYSATFKENIAQEVLQDR
jgi:hypothetical protein